MNSQHWRLEYEAALNDLIQVSLRAARRSYAVWVWRRHGSAWTALVACLVLGSFSPRWGGFPMWSTLVVCGICGVASAMLYVAAYDWFVRRRVSRLVVERVGDGPAVPCRIELRDEALWLRQGNTELVLSWRDSVSVRLTDFGVELLFKPGGFLFLLAPTRAFATPEHRQEFYERATALAAARSEIAEYRFQISSRVDEGVIYRKPGVLRWRFTTRAQRPPWSPLNLIMKPEFVIVDSEIQEVLRIRRQKRLPPRFDMSEHGRVIGTIELRSIFRNKYKLDLAGGSTWIIRMPLFTADVWATCTGGSEVLVRVGQAWNEWYVLAGSGQDDVRLLSGLAFIHRERWLYV